MKKVTIAIITLWVALFLSACSSSSTPKKSHYQLPSLEGQHKSKVNIDSSRQIKLVALNLAEHLSGTGIVYQTTPVKYVIANSNLWASSLQQQLKQTLRDNLNDALPNWLIFNNSSLNSKNELSVTVTGFHGRYDGHAIVKGEWILLYRNKTINKKFDIALKQNEDGYDDLVLTLSNAWKQVSQEIATNLRQNSL